MDPLSQAVVGGVAGQASAKKSHYIVATLLACLSGMAADIDVFIRSDVDPLLAIEYHRHFTHSLIFIPVGSLLCAMVFYGLFLRKRISFKQTFVYCLVGYATHALLDACTTYGTQLFWPFSNMRVAWNNVSVVDPLFTVPVLILMVSAVIYRNKKMTTLAIVYGLSYLLLGVVQNHRASDIGKKLALSRGHDVSEVSAKPSFANLVVWKTIYEYQGRFYVDAVRVLKDSKVYPGDSIAKLDVARDLPWLDVNSQQFKDIQRFKWFSSGYLAVSKKDPQLVVDMRYSMIPNQIDALWGIRLQVNAGKDQHVRYVSREKLSSNNGSVADKRQKVRDNFSILLKMIINSP